MKNIFAAINDYFNLQLDGTSSVKTACTSAQRGP